MTSAEIATLVPTIVAFLTALTALIRGELTRSQMKGTTMATGSELMGITPPAPEPAPETAPEAAPETVAPILPEPPAPPVASPSVDPQVLVQIKSHITEIESLLAALGL